MPTRDFDASRPAREPVTFTLRGASYTAAPSAPAQALLDAAAADSATDAADKVAALGKFMDAVLIPESATRFAAGMSDRANPIDLEDLAAVVAWLIEVYTARPTEQPSPSPSGPTTAGADSTPGAVSEALTPSP